MKYMLAIYEDEANFPGDEDGEAWRDILAKHTAFIGGLVEAGVQFSGAGLRPVNTATTVRISSAAQSVHDGPFAETREQLGGFYILDVPDLDQAIAWARRVPLAKGGSIEVRPVVEGTTGGG